MKDIFYDCFKINIIEKDLEVLKSGDFTSYSLRRAGLKYTYTTYILNRSL